MPRFIVPISGKDSLATAIVQRAYKPDWPYEYIFNRTGTELPDVDEWLDRVENTLDIRIVRIGASLIDIIEDIGMLPSMHARFCTRKSKIEPMEQYIAGDDAIVFYGLRADEKDRIGYDPTRTPHIRPVYPLVHFGFGLNDVWRLLADRNLLPPAFYWPILETLTRYELTKSLEAYNLPEWVTRMLFAGRSRMNCYHCFFQRPYEWIYTHTHYPDLFARAVAMENTIGGDNFTWIPGESLTHLLTRSGDIIQRRARKIAAIIEKSDREDADLLAAYSCGLLCGK